MTASSYLLRGPEQATDHPLAASAKRPWGARRMGSGAQPTATLLAAAAVLASAWPLGHLFTATPWSGVALLHILVVATVGMVLRGAGFGAPLVAASQLVAITLTQSVAFPAAQAPLGWLPAPSTLAHWGDLGGEAARTIMENAAPAPAPTGIAFVISGAIAVVSWAVDVVAVGSRMPAVAGLPLLTPFLTAAANSSAPLPMYDAIAPLGFWAALLLEQERDWFTSWRPDLAGTHRLPARGRRLAGGAALAAGAIALGLAAGGTAPHLPQRYLADGLGRGDLARGHRVGFSPNSDMLLDLKSGDKTPVLAYRTDDTDPPPLRVTVATLYASGRWSPDAPNVSPSRQPQLPAPAGLTDAVPSTEKHFRVDETGLAAPYLASPVPVVGGTVVGARWAVESETGVPVVDATPRSYDLTYLAVRPTPDQLQAAPPAQRGFRDALAIPDAADTALLRSTAMAVVDDAQTPYDAAVRIQNWLRDTAGFTYSLELTPAPAGMSEEEAADTAVDRFLKTQRGYCVQFATAMILMSRSQGIPARMATGFLPGSEEEDQRTVLASDAHAWPELYFEGVGWLRFEPTPSVRSGSVPPYAYGADAASTPASTATVTQTQTVTAPDNTAAERADTDPTPATDVAAEEPFSFWPLLRGLALIAALLSVVPAVAAGVRARRRALAGGPGQAAEAEWLILAERLEDLGLRIPTAATPRQLHARLTDLAVLDRASSLALRRVLGAVEDARYAPAPSPSRPLPPSAGTRGARGAGTWRGAAGTRGAGGDGGPGTLEGGLRSDALAVVKGASSLRAPSVRVRAALLPRAGLKALRLPVPGRGRVQPPRH